MLGVPGDAVTTRVGIFSVAEARKGAARMAIVGGKA